MEKFHATKHSDQEVNLPPALKTFVKIELSLASDVELIDKPQERAHFLIVILLDKPTGIKPRQQMQGPR